MTAHVEYGQHEWSYGPPGGPPSFWCKLFGHRWSAFVPAEKQDHANMTRLRRMCRRKNCQSTQTGWRA